MIHSKIGKSSVKGMPDQAVYLELLCCNLQDLLPALVWIHC